MEGESVAGLLSSAERILRQPLTISSLSNVARRIAQLFAALPPMTAEQLTQLLILRGTALAELSVLTRPEKRTNFADGAIQTFAQAHNRCGGSYAQMGWRSVLAYAGAWESLAGQSDNPMIYQKVVQIGQAAIAFVEPLHYDVYTHYVRALLRYACSLRYYCHFPHARVTLFRSLCQAASISMAMLDYYVGAESIAEIGVVLPSYCPALSFGGALRALAAPAETYLAADAAAWRAGEPFRSGSEWDSRVMRFNLIALCSKALWSLLSQGALAEGGEMATIRVETDKIVRWVASGQPHKPVPPAAPSPTAATTAVETGAKALAEREQLWTVVLGLSRLARAAAPVQAATADAALELHDATLEYLAAHATCAFTEKGEAGQARARASQSATAAAAADAAPIAVVSARGGHPHDRRYASSCPHAAADERQQQLFLQLSALAPLFGSRGPRTGPHGSDTAALCSPALSSSSSSASSSSQSSPRLPSSAIRGRLLFPPSPFRSENTASATCTETTTTAAAATGATSDGSSYASVADVSSSGRKRERRSGAYVYGPDQSGASSVGAAVNDRFNQCFHMCPAPAAETASAAMSSDVSSNSATTTSTREATAAAASTFTPGSPLNQQALRSAMSSLAIEGVSALAADEGLHRPLSNPCVSEDSRSSSAVGVQQQQQRQYVDRGSRWHRNDFRLNLADDVVQGGSGSGCSDVSMAYTLDSSAISYSSSASTVTDSCCCPSSSSMCSPASSSASWQATAIDINTPVHSRASATAHSSAHSSISVCNATPVHSATAHTHRIACSSGASALSSPMSTTCGGSCVSRSSEVVVRASVGAFVPSPSVCMDVVACDRMAPAANISSSSSSYNSRYCRGSSWELCQDCGGEIISHECAAAAAADICCSCCYCYDSSSLPLSEPFTSHRQQQQLQPDPREFPLLSPTQCRIRRILHEDIASLTETLRALGATVSSTGDVIDLCGSAAPPQAAAPAVQQHNSAAAVAAAGANEDGSFMPDTSILVPALFHSGSGCAHHQQQRQYYHQRQHDDDGASQASHVHNHGGDDRATTCFHPLLSQSSSSPSQPPPCDNDKGGAAASASAVSLRRRCDCVSELHRRKRSRMNGPVEGPCVGVVNTMTMDSSQNGPLEGPVNTAYVNSEGPVGTAYVNNALTMVPLVELCAVRASATPVTALLHQDPVFVSAAAAAVGQIQLIPIRPVPTSPARAGKQQQQRQYSASNTSSRVSGGCSGDEDMAGDTPSISTPRISSDNAREPSDLFSLVTPSGQQQQRCSTDGSPIRSRAHSRTPVQSVLPPAAEKAGRASDSRTSAVDTFSCSDGILSALTPSPIRPSRNDGSGSGGSLSDLCDRVAPSSLISSSSASSSSCPSSVVSSPSAFRVRRGDAQTPLASGSPIRMLQLFSSSSESSGVIGSATAGTEMETASLPQGLLELRPVQSDAPSSAAAEPTAVVVEPRAISQQQQQCRSCASSSPSCIDSAAYGNMAAPPSPSSSAATVPVTAMYPSSSPESASSDASSGRGSTRNGSCSSTISSSSRRGVRWSASVLAAEDTKRRLRIASFSETSFAPDGSPILSSHSPQQRTQQPNDSSAASAVVGASAAAAPAAVASDASSANVYGTDSAVFSPILPAGRLPGSIGSVSRVPGGWPHAMPSLRCVPSQPQPHSVLHASFDRRMGQTYAANSAGNASSSSSSAAAAAMLLDGDAVGAYGKAEGAGSSSPSLLSPATTLSSSGSGSSRSPTFSTAAAAATRAPPSSLLTSSSPVSSHLPAAASASAHSSPGSSGGGTPSIIRLPRTSSISLDAGADCTSSLTAAISRSLTLSCAAATAAAAVPSSFAVSPSPPPLPPLFLDFDREEVRDAQVVALKKALVAATEELRLYGLHSY